jgi:hypothetical protein
LGVQLKQSQTIGRYVDRWMLGVVVLVVLLLRALGGGVAE